MSRRALTTALGALLAVPLLLIGAAPASADQFYRWGETVRSFYHYGNPALGEFRTSVWVDEWLDDVDGDGVPDRQLIRGHARNCKVSKVLRTQVDLVRLGNATQGGIFDETTTPVNSGTAPCADSTTDWILVTEPPACAETFEAWTRGTFSARWSDYRLSSNVSYLSDRSGWEWCLVVAERALGR